MFRADGFIAETIKGPDMGVSSQAATASNSSFNSFIPAGT